MRYFNKNYHEEGIAIILTVLVVTLMLSVMLVISSIITPKIRSSSEIKYGVTALYAAESALEWCLYVERIASGSSGPTMSNGASYTIDSPGGCTISPVKATGKYNGISRAFEVSF